MQESTITKSFEQIKLTTLPKEIVKITTRLAREIRRSARKQALQPKQLEIACATLHMRIYQRIGPVSKEQMSQAYSLLERLLTESYLAFTSHSLGKALIGRFF